MEQRPNLSLIRKLNSLILKKKNHDINTRFWIYQTSIKDKSFKTFQQVVVQGMNSNSVSDETRKDITAIDMIFRVFCLGDVMVNAGNLGSVDRTNKKMQEAIPDKWKVIDVLVQKLKRKLKIDIIIR